MSFKYESQRAVEDRNWQERYNCLVEFYNTHKHINIPVDYVDSTGHYLRNWCMWQKRLYADKLLRDDRKKALDKLSFWSWKRKYCPRKWDVQFRALLRYLEKNNKYPHHSSRLGIWLQKQKTLFQNNKLDDKKIEAFRIACISLKTKQTLSWEENFKLLSRLKDLPSQSTSLGNWCYKQKKKYRDNKLSRKQVIKLESLSFWRWEIKKEGKPWSYTYRQFCRFIEKHERFPKRNEKLGSWFYKQRHRIQKGTIPEKQLKKLRKIDGWIW